MRDFTLTRLQRAVGAAAMVLAGAAASAQEASPWEFEANLHGWSAGFATTNRAGDDLTIDIVDVLKNVRFAGMGGAAVRYGDFGLFGDFVYANLADGKNRTANIAGNPATVGAHLELSSFISTVGATYDFYEQGRHDIRALAGARYFYMGTDLTLALPRRNPTFSANGVSWDAVVGVEGRYRLVEDLWLTYYADVGSGESDLTYQVDAGFEFNPGRFGLIGGVRFLHFELDGSTPLKAVSAYGPYLGAIARF